MLRPGILVVALLLALPAAVPGAQEPPADSVTAASRHVPTLEDILARQRGEAVPSRERPAGADGAAGDMRGHLGPLGAVSDPELWERLRYGTADVTVSAGGPAARVLVQDSGIPWLSFRAGPLREYGGYLLAGTLGLLAVFYLLRGTIRIEAGRSGLTVPRFGLLERAGHWLLAGAFVLLALTGLFSLFGRVALIPLFGRELFAAIAAASKWVHNWVAWPFMAALALVFLMWVLRNIPDRHDLVWLLRGGGMFSKRSHPPAKKFNAGQKIVFWGVVILGASVSVSGLSLLMPFELPLFAKTFAALNALGAPGWFGADPLPDALTPQAEMQLAQLWHAIVAFAMMALILAHIYIGTIGMEGAFEAMSTGEVDLNWAREHHSLWVEEAKLKAARDAVAVAVAAE